MRSSTKVVLVALAAGALGVVASLAATGPGPLLGSEWGQRVLSLMLSASAPEPPTGVAVARRDQRIATLALEDLGGRTVHLPDAWRGRPLLINVWASWCGPCIEEMPELQRFANEQGANGVQVVGIALDYPQSVAAFLERIRVDYPILIDTPGPADAGVRLGNTRGVLPYSVLVSADGRLLKQRIGPFAKSEITEWARQ